jgi:hypothetical protein
MHEVEGLIARRDKLAAGAGKLKNAILCTLVQDFALLPLTDDLVIELKAYNADTKPALARPRQHISDALHAFAIDISRNGPVAYVNTYYFGGRGGRSSGTKGHCGFHRHRRDMTRTGPIHPSAKRSESSVLLPNKEWTNLIPLVWENTARRIGGPSQ